MLFFLACIPALVQGVVFKEQGADFEVDNEGHKHGFAVAFADVDADGDLDVFVTNSDDFNRLYIRNGLSFYFQDATESANLKYKGSSRGATFADVNGDGVLDLYVTTASEANLLYINDGKGHFEESAAAAGVDDHGMSQGACFADVDSDGDLDLLVMNFAESNNLYLNDGRGVFKNATVAAGLTNDASGFGCTFGDIDGDGDLDLYVSNSGSLNNLYINNGKGIFTDNTEQAGCPGNTGQGRAVSFADFDGDGHLDLFMVSATSSNQMYINDGTGNFGEITAPAGVESYQISQGMNVADVDGDGDLDIYVSNIGTSGILYENSGRASFTDITSAAGVDFHMFGQGVAFGDVNGDGHLDMYVCTWGVPPLGWPSQSNKLFINQGSSSPWLKVRPLDENGHATLLGTEVRVYPAGRKDFLAAAGMQIDGGSGFCSQNAYDAYFGLSGAVAKFDAKTFDIEMRCGGHWVTKETDSKLGGVTPNQVIAAQCTPSSSLSSIIV